MAALHVACWREAYTAIVPAELSARFSTIDTLGSWQRHLGDETRIIVAAYDGDTPVGFINEGKPVDPVFDGMDGHIAALYVLASHYRLGIGRQLMALGAAAWLARGGSSLALGVLAQNQRAVAFYQALGGRRVKDSTFTWHGHALPNAIFVFEDLKRLAAGAPPLTP
jgi:ribosomal protein S18 acetylase RimI-like enzyme